jgi:hypothetical protein
MRRCITMAMGCLDPLSNDPDERLAWYRLHDALEGKEPRNCLTYDLDPRSPAEIIRDNWEKGPDEALSFTPALCTPTENKG